MNGSFFEANVFLERAKPEKERDVGLKSTRSCDGHSGQEEERRRQIRNYFPVFSDSLRFHLAGIERFSSLIIIFPLAF